VASYVKNFMLIGFLFIWYSDFFSDYHLFIVIMYRLARCNPIKQCRLRIIMF
jgi:hypothetical protein